MEYIYINGEWFPEDIVVFDGHTLLQETEEEVKRLFL